MIFILFIYAIHNIQDLGDTAFSAVFKGKLLNEKQYELTENIGGCCLKPIWLLIQHLWPTMFVGFGLQRTSRLYNFCTDP